MLQLRRGCTLVGKTEGPAAQGHGTVDGAQQRRRNPLHVGIGAVRHMIGNKLCRRQDIAQVVIDLSDCGPERCQPGALFERIAQAPLHLGQLALGAADLVAPAVRADQHPRILEVTTESFHAVGNTQHRTDEKPLQAAEIPASRSSVT